MVSGLWPEPVIDIARGNRVLIPAEVLNDFDEILLASIQMSDGARTVSYTHLPLPTSELV